MSNEKRKLQILDETGAPLNLGGGGPASSAEAPPSTPTTAAAVKSPSAKKSALRATKHEAIKKRLKLFLFGGAGVGKTTAAVAFPRSYVIDAEHGCDHYAKQLNASDSVLLQTTNADEVVAEVRALGSEKHAFRTLVLDPITPLETDLIERAEKEFGAGDMRIWGKRDRTLRRLTNLIMNLDMNVVVTAHGKIEYGDKMAKLGTTFDGWKRLPYIFDLVLELERRGKKRVAIVRKTRLEGFPDGEEFDFSYEEIARRYGVDEIGREAVPATPAAPEQVATLKSLIDTVRLDEGVVDAWLKKAGVDELEDMPADAVTKCIEFVRKKIEQATGGAK